MNKRYIDIFEKELDLAIATKELQQANWIQSKIQILKTEVEDLNNSKVT